MASRKRTATQQLLERSEKAKEQLKRLAGLRGYPSDKEAQTSLIDAMLTAPTLVAMKNFVDDWLKENDVYPVPKSLYDAFKPPEPVSQWNTGCKKCGGTGWIHFTKRVQIGGLAPYDAASAKRCECLTARIMQAGLDLK